MSARIVRASWDEEAKVWHASSDDVPGLVAEEPTYEALLATVLELAPELLRLNASVDLPKPDRF